MNRKAANRLALAVVLAAGYAPAPLLGQYALSASDTLRYSEVTKGNVDMAMPSGTVSVGSLHEALIAVTFPTPGRAEAWYEDLVVESSGPAGTVRPHTAPLLGQPFELQFAPTGRVTALTAPGMPPAVAEVTDLTRQFDDFFVTVPPGALSPGATWVDTIVNEKAARDSDRTSTRHVRSYVVERDTSVAGVPAVLIRVSQSVEVNAMSEMREENMTVSSRLTGTDEGWVLFSPSLGVMLERQRTGSLEGRMLMQPSGMAPMAIPQSYTYESRIKLRNRIPPGS